MTCEVMVQWVQAGSHPAQAMEGQLAVGVSVGQVQRRLSAAAGRSAVFEQVRSCLVLQ